MRFRLDFTLEKNELPLNYRKAFMSFIKTSLISCNDGEYFERYYKDTIQKDFTYAIILPNPHFTKEKILLEKNSFYVILSADDSRKTGFLLFQAFVPKKYKKNKLAGENSMWLANLSILPQKLITSSKAYLRSVTGAPLCIREHNRETNKDSYVSIADKDFEQKLNDVLRRQLKEAGMAEEKVDQLRLKVLDGKKVVIKHYCYIDCTACVLEAEGDPLLLQYMYDNGILSRRAEGFGMLELIE